MRTPLSSSSSTKSTGKRPVTPLCWPFHQKRKCVCVETTVKHSPAWENSGQTSGHASTRSCKEKRICLGREKGKKATHFEMQQRRLGSSQRDSACGKVAESADAQEGAHAGARLELRCAQKRHRHHALGRGARRSHNDPRRAAQQRSLHPHHAAARHVLQHAHCVPFAAHLQRRRPRRRVRLAAPRRRNNRWKRKDQVCRHFVLCFGLSSLLPRSLRQRDVAVKVVDRARLRRQHRRVGSARSPVGAVRGRWQAGRCQILPTHGVRWLLLLMMLLLLMLMLLMLLLVLVLLRQGRERRSAGG
jgi:hypothetical protein